MEEFLKLFRYVLSPESDWSKFFRKSIGIIMSATLGAFIWNGYIDHTSRGHGERAVTEVLSESDAKENQVRDVLEEIKRSDPAIESVWLYSWPDALQLVPVMYVGNSINPMPHGSFIWQDSDALGVYLFGDCAQLARPVVNYTCPINGMEDSWGVLVVVYRNGTEVSSSQQGMVAAAARRISLIIYSNNQHVTELRD